MILDTVRVELGERSYDIVIGRGSLSRLGERLGEVSAARRVMVVSNTTVFSLYGERVLEILRDSGFRASCHSVPDGEEYKSLATVAEVYKVMVSEGMDRESLVLSLGGGVVGDLAGFVAATYMRGIPFVQVPTTLLAQVDASVGGKVGVNLPSGKNLVGAFHQPLLVLTDTEVLGTLERRDLVAGLAEVIKHAIVRDGELFRYIEEEYPKILALDEEPLAYVIKRCCELKAEIVSEDERERGVRTLLNYGHTIGHALEALAGYGKYRHGEAIAVGMVGAARISWSMGHCSEEESLRQESLIEAVGLPVTVSGLRPDDIMARLAKDKKVSREKVRFVLCKGIGDVFVTPDVPDSTVRDVLEEIVRE